MRYALFLGCNIPARVDQYDTSARAVLRQVGVQLKDIRELLVGNTMKSRFNEPDRLSIMNRVNWAMIAMRTTYGPTKTHQRDYEIAQEEFETLFDQIKELIEVDFIHLQKKLEAAGLPWTSGRPIPELKK